jgi:SAM-dependent methyltransferase
MLWIEGLSQRIGEDGSVTALDLDAKCVEAAREQLEEAELVAPVRLIAGDVFEMPFLPGTFDIVYSAGLLHELECEERTAEEALAALASAVRPGGRLATSDFVNTEPAVQLEDEGLQADLAREVFGRSSTGSALRSGSSPCTRSSSWTRGGVFHYPGLSVTSTRLCWTRTSRRPYRRCPPRSHEGSATDGYP